MMGSFIEEPYSELIYRFMEGETNGVQQKILFDALANDSELQYEFQQAVAIVKGFNADKMALMPPARLTNAVFTSAGFSAPMQFSSSNVSSFVAKFKNIAIPISSALVGSLVSALIFFGFFINDNNGSISSQPVVNNKSTAIPSNSTETSSISMNNITFSGSKDFTQESKINDDYNEINLCNTIKKTTIQPIAQENTLAYEIQDNSTVQNNPLETRVKDPGLLNLSLEVKGNTNLAFLPGRDIAPEKFNIANNIALGLLYVFSNNHSAGLYIGRESLQMYSYQQIDEGYIFNLEPSLFWAGACYKYTGEEIYGSIHPFSELILAGTKFGPIAKSSFGLTYNPENFLSMSLGIEGSSLVYKFLGDYKTTEKISFIYNVGIHF